MTIKHTPTPWALSEGRIIDKNHNVLANVPYSLGDKTDRVNAAFIVNACNSHDKLVAAIKKVALILNAQDDPRYSIHHPLVKPLLEALAIAEEN